MKKYIIPFLAAIVAFTACNQADKFQYGKEIVLVTGTDASPISSDRILADQVDRTKPIIIDEFGDGLVFRN